LQILHYEKKKNKKVLEIGCGMGTAATNFIKNGAEY
jgi:ubiquinone/menaquinone biosynthesis C-methylase UbiE